MITKHKSRIALAACLLLAQSIIVMPMGSFKVFPSAEEILGAIGSVVGVVLLMDGVTDMQYLANRDAVSKKRQKAVELGLKMTPEIDRKELTRRAARAIPDSVHTSANTRIFKAISGALLCAGGVWLCKKYA